MGQKVHPYGFRVGITRPWNSRWYADKQHFGDWLLEDQKIRRFIREKLKFAAVAKVEIERAGDEIRVILHTARPGIVIGKRGVEIERLKLDLQELVGSSKKVNPVIREIDKPELDAQLVAEGIAEQLAKRTSFRRAMKKAVETTMAAGARGIKVICSGRLGGAEIARSEPYMAGSLPLHTLQADIDYGFAESKTTYGRIGVKVWVYRGRLTVEKPTVTAQET